MRRCRQWSKKRIEKDQEQSKACADETKKVKALRREMQGPPDSKRSLPVCIIQSHSMRSDSFLAQWAKLPAPDVPAPDVPAPDVHLMCQDRIVKTLRSENLSRRPLDTEDQSCSVSSSREVLRSQCLSLRRERVEFTDDEDGTDMYW